MRQDFMHACQIEKIKLMWLLLDCPTRWNTSYLMLERVFRYRQPFEVVLRGCKQLNRLVLNDDELKVVEDLLFLKPFLDVTKMMSSGKYVGMSFSAAVYIILYKHLETFQASHSGQNVILTVASAAMEKFNKYYRSSDAMVYVMGLRPPARVSQSCRNG
ncbi:unnamed protein product [Allacma fusca]|uniref:Uncharacterized protein n=1 Tax=Allacma fusca TaxID=39272 RepID=A0A8J2NZ42_9HEXA|nr:unnamed protein product [Allacma fusca]